MQAPRAMDGFAAGADESADCAHLTLVEASGELRRLCWFGTPWSPGGPAIGERAPGRARRHASSPGPQVEGRVVAPTPTLGRPTMRELLV